MFDKINIQNVNGVTNINMVQKGTFDQKITVDFNKTSQTKERPLGYQNPNWEEAQDIAQDFYDAMAGFGTDTDKINKACEKINKYNVLEVLESFSTLKCNKESKSLMQFIRGDFNNYGGGNTFWEDDCKNLTDRIFKLLQDRSNDMKNDCDFTSEYYGDFSWDFGDCNATYSSVKRIAYRNNGKELRETYYSDFGEAYDPTRVISRLARSLHSFESAMYNNTVYDNSEAANPGF